MEPVKRFLDIVTSLTVAFAMILVGGGLPYLRPVAGAIAYVGGVKNNNGNASNCTMTYTPATGNTYDIIVGISGTAAVVTSITATGNTFVQKAFSSNGNTRSEIWGVLSGTSTTSFQANVDIGGSDIVCIFVEHSGVVAYGAATNSITGTSTTPSVDLTTQDSNNFVIGGHAGRFNSAPTAGTGNLRNADFVSATDRVGAGATDNTAGSPSLVTNSVTGDGSQVWASCAIELRSTTGGAQSATAKITGAVKVTGAVKIK